MDGSLFPAAEIAGLLKPSRRRKPKPSFGQYELDNRINVVLFAGLGGACQGLEDAGCPIHVANNHDEVALAAHMAMHPNAKHVRGDIFDVDPLVATNGRKVMILWASPDCKDHSVAKGGAPRSKRVRSLPWQVLRWIGKTQPDLVMMENVREIRGWGPLVAKRDKATGRVVKHDGTVAAKGERVPVQDQQLIRNKNRLGRSFRHFVAGIRKLGYEYEDRDLCAADFGVPTTRRRWFAVARRDGLPIEWPVRTHAPRATAAKLGLQPWVGAASIIDWSIPMPSIFARTRPLAPATLERIRFGMKRYVIDSPAPFLMPVTHKGLRSHDAAEPLPTQTTAKGGDFVVVKPTVQPVGAFVTGCGGRAAQVQPASVEDPFGTLTTKGDRIIVAPVMTVFNENCVGGSVEDPLGTMMAGAPRFGVMAAALSEMRGHSVGQAVDDPLATQTARQHSAVMAGTLVQMGYGEREGQDPRALDVKEPIGTLVGARKHGVVGAWMIQHNTGVVGHEMEEPVSTLTCGMSQQNVGAAFLTEMRGTSTARDAEEPCPVLTAGGTHVGVTGAFLTQYYSNGTTSQDAGEPLATCTTKGRFGVVGIDGVPQDHIADMGEGYVQETSDFLNGRRSGDRPVTMKIRGRPHAFTDIGMRMLTPYEGAAAHELALPKFITLNGVTRRLTGTEATRLVGNSVPKRLPKLMVEVNAPHLLTRRPAPAPTRARVAA